MELDHGEKVPMKHLLLEVSVAIEQFQERLMKSSFPKFPMTFTSFCKANETANPKSFQVYSFESRFSANPVHQTVRASGFIHTTDREQATLIVGNAENENLHPFLFPGQ
jgi:hypothetical protein